MVFQDSGNFNDGTSFQPIESPMLFGNEAMVDKNFNEMFNLTKQTGQVDFLPSNDYLLTQLEDVQVSSYSYGPSEQVSTNPADQVSVPGDDLYADPADQVSVADPADQVSVPGDDGYVDPADQASIADPAEQIGVGPYPQDLVSVDESYLGPDSLAQASDATTQASNASYYQFADGQTSHPSERPAQQYPRSEADNKQVGPLEFGFDDYGNHVSITGPGGEYFYKGSDGKWVEHMPPSSERVVENFNVDNAGNMQFDVVGDGTLAHHKRNADGSHSVDSPETGLLVYDKDGHLIQAPSGDGPPRKFHYEKGQLVGIEGNLGNWQRKVVDGKVTWENDKGLKWEGEMHINPKTNDLEFRGSHGNAWNFTTRGQSVRVKTR